MGWRDWQISDDWTHKPIWLPPYPIPYGFWGNVTPFFSKKEIIDEVNGMEWKDHYKPKYYFFDTPDYADCHKKIFNYGVFGIKLASIVGAIDVLANKQLSYMNAFGRASGHFGRIGGTFLMYPAIVCCVANLRGQKHDTWEHPWNHIIGGASTGLIWGYKYKSTGFGFGVAIVGALFGVLNLRANTPTEYYPTGWQILPPDDMEEIREENGTLGGKHYRNIFRRHWVVSDPGRKGLE